MSERGVFELVSRAIEAAGVAAIVIGIVIATARFVADVARHHGSSYHRFRRSLGQTLLLGLELLVAADIVATVAVDPSFTSLGVLAILVAVRTFLSWALEVEIEGQWPWTRGGRKGEASVSVEGRDASHAPSASPSGG